jgi:hypothetical protein
MGGGREGGYGKKGGGGGRRKSGEGVSVTKQGGEGGGCTRTQ